VVVRIKATVIGTTIAIKPIWLIGIPSGMNWVVRAARIQIGNEKRKINAKKARNLFS
jgi:hypothetical protein